MLVSIKISQYIYIYIYVYIYILIYGYPYIYIINMLDPKNLPSHHIHRYLPTHHDLLPASLHRDLRTCSIRLERRKTLLRASLVAGSITRKNGVFNMYSVYKWVIYNYIVAMNMYIYIYMYNVCIYIYIHVYACGAYIQFVQMASQPHCTLISYRAIRRHYYITYELMIWCKY